MKLIPEFRKKKSFDLHSGDEDAGAEEVEQRLALVLLADVLQPVAQHQVVREVGTGQRARVKVLRSVGQVGEEEGEGQEEEGPHLPNVSFFRVTPRNEVQIRSAAQFIFFFSLFSLHRSNVAKAFTTKKSKKRQNC